jgi:glycosyltransferase involved in cell wall biosynthesis
VEVLASLRRAGAEQVAASLACALDPARFETTVVSLYDAFPDGFEATLEEHGVPVRHLGKRRGADPRVWARLAGVFGKTRPHIVHTHSYVLRYAWPAALAGHAGRVVHTVHNLAHREVEWLGRALHRLAFRCGVVPVAICEEVARSFREVYGFPPAAIIPNGIEADRFECPQAKDAWRRANGFAVDDVLIVSVGRLEPQKNPLGLIDAFAMAYRGGQPWRLLMAGEGSLRAAACERARHHGIADRVHFLGARTDIPDVLCASDIFALASLWEGSPIAVMEAMAARLPVIVTAVGGMAELVEQGRSGVLAPPGDPQAVAEAIAVLAADPPRRRALGETGAARARAFDVHTMAASYAALFERLARVSA